MDEQKDTQRTDLSRFFEPLTVKTNPFGGNKSAERAYARTERLTAALHLLTNHIPSDEPLRASVRQNALSLVEQMLNIKNEMRAAESSRLARIRSQIRHLISLVRMLTVSGYVSIQNSNLIVEALDDLGSLLSSSQRSPLSEGVLLSRDDLVDTGPIAYTPQPRRFIKDIKDRVAESMSVTTPASSANTDPMSRMNSRKENIMQILRGGGELGIRDIAAHVPEYSEKTVQRELAELVSQGKVKKVGLKRWSRYIAA